MTPFLSIPDAVLNELVEKASAILGDNFCGAYLQGSFAVGDADEHSDVDFIIVTHDAVGEPAVLRLRALHADLPHRDGNWPQHLEGSYFPKEILRRPDPSYTPLLYVDNGSDILELLRSRQHPGRAVGVARVRTNSGRAIGANVGGADRG